MTVAARVLGGIGAFLLALAALYWFTSYEDAGSVMLLLAAVLGLMLGAYLWVTIRRVDADDEVDLDERLRAAAVDDAYLPHASVWPFVLGVGALLGVNGLLLGGWALVPGAIVGFGALWGYARQSRRRD